MAIDSSNSNIVSINSLPQTQLAVDGDLLILQTENGVQTIDFQSFNVVKTDAVGNATVLGSISGNDAYFSNVKALRAVDAQYFVSNNNLGTYAPNNYYNTFTINGGIITSAAYVLGSPEYDNLTTSFLPNLTTFQNSIYKVVVDESSGDSGQSPVIVLQGRNSQAYNLAGFYGRYPNITPGSVQPQHFILASTVILSCCPFVTNIVSDGAGGLTFTVNAGYAVTQDSAINWRLLYTYTNP